VIQVLVARLAIKGVQPLNFKVY